MADVPICFSAKATKSFFFKWSIKSSRRFRSYSFSFPLSVFIINLLSFEKKKNDPLLPAPYPDLKMASMFFSRFSDYMKSSGAKPSIFII